MSRQEREASETGVTVYPRLPVPKGGEPRQAPTQRPLNKLLLGVVSAVFVAGVVLGAVVRPLVLPDARIAEARKQAEDAGAAAAAQRTRADGLEKDLDAATAKKREVEKRLEVASKAETKLADTAADEEKRAKELEAVQKKLVANLRGTAAVAIDGRDLRITINTGLLFVKDDALSAGGKQIIDRVGTSLKELLDKRIAVHGHTDDTPLPLPKPAPAPAPPKKGQRPAPAAPAPPPPRFLTNWELSAGRAVAVVRQLQESSKIDPGRLSAAGFGQYHPISRRDRNANRRIEIVLSPKPKQ